MSTQSKIEWTERTWNPVVGCKKVSQGCKNCYAETMAHRLQAIGVRGYLQPFTEVQMMDHRLDEPLRVKRPSVWFVNSMSDLYQEEIPDEFIERVFDTMRRAHWHQFQVLTKRADRMEQFHSARKAPPNNVWLGVSVENRHQGLPRIDHLRKAPATVRFLSVEPLLEDLGAVDLEGIHWVIVGGESGPRARPMKLSWALSIQRQCEAAGVPFFFKQWGTFGQDGEKRSKRSNGRLLDGLTWDQLPSVALA